MPSYLTHRISGENLFNSIEDKEIKKLLKDNIRVYALGCQGADIFFYHKYLFGRAARKSLRFGSALHSLKVKEFFEGSLKFIKSYKGEDKDQLKAYFYGYIMHYCSDKNVHPFIYKKSDNCINTHHRTEHMMDTLYTKDMWNQDAGSLDLYSDIYFGQLPGSIGKWYSKMAKEIYDKDLPQDVPNEAYEDMAKIKKIFTQPGFFTRILFRLYNLVLPINLFSLVYLEEDGNVFIEDDEYEYLKKQLDSGVQEAKEKILAAGAYFKDEKSFEEVAGLFKKINFVGSEYE